MIKAAAGFPAGTLHSRQQGAARLAVSARTRNVRDRDHRLRASLVQWLQREDRVTWRQIVERLHRRSLRDREEALDLAGEAVEICLENGWTHVGWKLARMVAAAAHRTDERDLTRRPSIAHPIGVAAGADQVALPFEIERIHRQRDRPAALSPSDFEYVEVAPDQANPYEKHERTSQDALEGVRPEIV